MTVKRIKQNLWGIVNRWLYCYTHWPWSRSSFLLYIRATNCYLVMDQGRDPERDTSVCCEHWKLSEIVLVLLHTLHGLF